jgi:hypothetical protein
MEFDELSNRVTRNWIQDYWSRPMSSAFEPFVFFVVKQSLNHPLSPPGQRPFRAGGRSLTH